MCGRYALDPRSLPRVSLAALAQLATRPARADVRPSEPVPIVRGDLELTDAQWWLVPRMAADPAAFRKTYTTFNARVDRLLQSKIFAPIWRRSQRCVMPMSGYYEWTTIEGSKKKQRWWIAPEDGALLHAAGLWETWEPRFDGLPITSCTMLCDEALPELSHIHDRRPLLVPDALVEEWLVASPDRAAEMMLAMTGPRLVAAAVAGPIAIGDAGDAAGAGRANPAYAPLFEPRAE